MATILAYCPATHDTYDLCPTITDAVLGNPDITVIARTRFGTIAYTGGHNVRSQFQSSNPVR